MSGEWSDFVTPIPSLLKRCDRPLMRLDPEVEAEVARKLRAFREHRAAALVSAQFYVIHGSSQSTRRGVVSEGERRMGA